MARLENVNELKTNILGYIKETGDATLAGFLDEVALYTDIDSYDRDTDCAVMMTMHSAKGLEFPEVYIVGMEEGLFPGVRCIGEPEEMEEERRLCYVALTRARERLYLSCARQRMIFGRTSMNLPSRFTEEIPEEDLERQGVSAQKKPGADEEAERRPGSLIKSATTARSGQRGSGQIRCTRPARPRRPRRSRSLTSGTG